MTETYTEDRICFKCQNPISHKLFFTSPKFLDQHGIKYNITFQEQNQLMITFAGCYHSGINLGTNVNSTANYANDVWGEREAPSVLERVEEKKSCECPNRMSSNAFVNEKINLNQIRSIIQHQGMSTAFYICTLY